MTPSEVLDRFAPARDALAELVDRDAVRRLHDRDVTLWSDEAAHQAVAAQRLGWLDVAGGKRGWAERLELLPRELADDGLTSAVLAGMGGSSLAPEVFARVLGPQDQTALDLAVLDSTHPDAVRAALDDRDLGSTLVIVSSKSGTTEETRAFGAHAARLVEPARQLVAITDPGSALAEEAQAGAWREVFLNPSNIGGRYSALSLFGMVPAALLGVDTEALWSGGVGMRDASQTRILDADHPAAGLAAFAGGLARTGRDKLTLLAPPELAPLGDWIEQLVAESTGKQGAGIVPVVGEPIGPPDVYGEDRAFVELRLGGAPVAGAAALAAAGQPVLTLDVPDRLALGAEFVRWELATALAAVLLGVDPFDEPNVAESKANTRAVLAEVEADGMLPSPGDGDVGGLLAGLRPGDYLSIQCYLAPSVAGDEALTRLRAAVRDRTGVATTVGWGPRFLHSTGQLHKGGPDSVVALQIVDAPVGGPDIPGRPYDFATLVRAQAVGDLRSLRDHGRRVTQVRADGEAGLRDLVDRVVRGVRQA